MEWLQNLVSGENGMAVQLVTITLGLVALLILVFWLFRKMTGASAPKSSRNRVPRLSVTDSARVDESRYLVLVRRDNVEHLVMIGGPSDVVIESNIVRIPDVTSSTAPMQTAPKAQEKPAIVAAKINEPPVKKPASKIEPSVVPAATAAVAAIATTDAVKSSVTPDKSENISPAIETPELITAKSEEIKIAEEDLSVEINLDDIESEITQNLNQETNKTAPADNKIDLEASISEQLDEALSGERIEIASQIEDPVTSKEAEISIDEPAVKADKNEEEKDDMQRLLDELAGINQKEPA